MRFLYLGAIVGPLPNTLTNGTIADATQVMGDLNWIVNQVNANATQGAGSITRNVLINGAMQFAQRLGGTSTTLTLTGQKGYGVDRWQAQTGASQTGVISQITSIGLTQFQYACRVQRQAGQTATTTIALAQSLETVDSYPLQAQTVTLSFYARAGADYSPTANALVANVITGTGTDENVLTGYTGAATSITQTFNITNNWLRYQVSGTVASGATELGTTFTMTPTGTAGTNDYFDVTGVQLELAPTASNFEFLPISVILPKCLRYYQKSFAYATVPATNVVPLLCYAAQTVGSSSNQFFPSYTLPSPMRDPIGVPFTATVYNPAAANNQIRNLSRSTDYTSSSISVDANALLLFGTTPGGSAAGDIAVFHYTIDGEL